MEIIASAVPHLHGYVGMFWQQRCVLGGDRMHSGQLSEPQTAQRHTRVLLCGFWKVCLYWGWKSIPTFDNTESYISSAIYTSITIIILGSRIRAILHFNYTV